MSCCVQLHEPIPPASVLRPTLFALQGIELLPYHLLGKNKWDELGLKYPLVGVQTPPLAQTLEVVDKLEAAGLNVICDAKRLRPKAAAQ